MQLAIRCSTNLPVDPVFGGIFGSIKTILTFSKLEFILGIQYGLKISAVAMPNSTAPSF